MPQRIICKELKEQFPDPLHMDNFAKIARYLIQTKGHLLQIIV